MDKWKSENAVEIDRINKEIDKLRNKDASSPLNSKSMESNRKISL
jgi:hypothetical protein